MTSMLTAFVPTGDSFMVRWVEPVIYSLVFATVGVVIFAIAFFVMAKVAPFSLRKEIEHDQNTSLGIVIGSVIIGLSLIISSAIKG
jgi:putative membrane protein